MADIIGRSLPERVPPTMRAVLAVEGKCVVDEAYPTPEAGPGEILIKVYACGINRLDTMQRKGKAKPPPGVTPVLGLEVAGVVASVGPGSDAEGGWAVGERVMALVSGGGYAEFCVASTSTVMRVPSSLSWAQAAGVPEAFLTAFQLLHTVGSVQRGETVLIHAGSSGVGCAAVQLAVQAGAGAVLVTVGTDEKLQLCKRLGAKGGAVRHAGPWADSLRSQGLLPVSGLNGGVDLVLDCVGADYVLQNLEALNVDGRWVLFSLLSGGVLSSGSTAAAAADSSSSVAAPGPAQLLLPKLMAKRLSLTATTLRGRSAPYKASLAASFGLACLPALDQGALEVVVHSVLPGGLDDAQKAHDLMESNASAGKIILALNE
mmetsp:Transcript_19495/g.32991  ORF Transcript_19495/g.32991 Transcript_19495/m.32991 type:complete len:375 (-) Transcript_19495:309-1433(-)